MNNVLMHEQSENEDLFDGLDYMRKAREVSAVLKYTLIDIRENDKECLVFVCEGADDKPVYFHWLRDISPELQYEFIVADGKTKVLEFRRSLSLDTAGLGDRVYYLIDRDFDGLRDYPLGPDVYVSSTYSFENWLVTESVLDTILSVDLHCHAQPLARAEIAALFQKIYRKFLDVTKSINYRVFLARNLRINTQTLPRKAAKIARVALLDVQPLEVENREIIKLDREPTTEEAAQHTVDFERLDGRQHYRGKFAFAFFLRWLNLLAKDRNSKESILFETLREGAPRATEQFTLDSIASRSNPPPDFTQFIRSILSISAAGFGEAASA